MSITKHRPGWDQTRIQQAEILAKRSLCTRDQVGAVIVDAGNKVIGEGYNGPPAGFKAQETPCTNWCQRARKQISIDTRGPSIVVDMPGFSPIYDDCPSLHAEANALITSDRSLRVGGTIYVTSDICMGCAKLIANSGLTKVYVKAKRYDKHRNPDASYDFLRNCGLTVHVQRPGKREGWDPSDGAE